MIRLTKPSAATIQVFIAEQATGSFSYPHVGSTLTTPPADYRLSHHRAKLGQGEAAFEAACQALRNWKMFELGWVQLCWPNAKIETGTTVGVLVKLLGTWWLNAAKIVYTLDEAEAANMVRRRFGFAYGTLPGHAERGEERFLVEWHADDSVWYDLLAFSQPSNWMAKLGGPVTRHFQTRFAVESLAAMQRAVENCLH